MTEENDNGFTDIIERTETSFNRKFAIIGDAIVQTENLAKILYEDDNVILIKKKG